MALRYLYPDADFVTGIMIEDCGGQQRIVRWDYAGEQPSEEEILSVVNSDGYKTWLANIISAGIDATTERSINTVVHEECPIGEQIGILRDQVARILNGDMTPSDDFSRLNEIAIAEIEKARIEKEAL